MRYIDERLGFFLTFFFVLSFFAWLIVIVVFNLPGVIGALTWSWLGEFPLNTFVFIILMVAGWVLLFYFFRLLFRIFEKEIPEDDILEE